MVRRGGAAMKCAVRQQSTGIVCALVLTAIAQCGWAQQTGAQGSAPVAPGVFAGDTRELPIIPTWHAGETIRQAAPRRITHPQAARVQPIPQLQPDPLLEVQTRSRVGVPRVFTPPELDFAGQGFTGVVPPDTEGEVGANYYIQAINSNLGTTVTIYDKSTGGVVSGPFTLSDLWNAGGPCVSGGGDPIALYDPLASRWLLSEFASAGNHLCVYLSRNNDPIGGGWLNYDFITPEFPDYPKYAVWPDGYYVTTNESAPAVYALDRAKMLAGQAATFQRFTAPSLSGFGFQALTPADLDGNTPPPPGSDAFFVRHRDDELSPPAVAGSDQLEVWQLHADFTTPANSVFSMATSIAVAEFNSNLCGVANVDCIPQPGTSQHLDALREIVMWRAQYRNFNTYQTLVGNFVTNADGAGTAGIRWFELRRTGLGAWGLFQEGTYAPDSDSRWTGSIAMDGSGNMALGFSISSSAVFPGMRYTGRLSADGLGAMTQPEVTVAGGSFSQTGIDRWGDYSAMNVDPVNDCTFWATNEYITAGGTWATRITRFRYDPPTCVDAPAPTCGNNVKEVGEDCDGTDSSFCPGLCTGSCTCPAPVCGNNIIEVGESCDGSSLGSCPGGCNPDCTCKLCGTSPAPAASCFLQAVPLKAALHIVDVADNTKDKLQWSWTKGVATVTSDFGNPLSGGATRYELCVYDSSPSSQPLMDAAVAPGGTCDGKPCWKLTRTGFSYKSKSGSAHGITKISLKGGEAAKSSVKVQGKGVNLSPPNPVLTLPVTVQLIRGAGGTSKCWQTQYVTATKNDDEQFKAKGP